MGEPLLTVSATVTCPHGGQGTIAPSQSAVVAGSTVCTEADQVTIAGCPFTIGPNPSPCRVGAVAERVNHQHGGRPGPADHRQPGAVPQPGRRAAGPRGPGARSAGGGGDMTAQQPWRLGAGRRLATADYLAHLDDLVRIVLQTGPSERLHRPGFGAGLGASALFEPLSDALGATVTARARGSLADALGDRIQVLDVTVDGGRQHALGPGDLPPAAGRRQPHREPAAAGGVHCDHPGPVHAARAADRHPGRAAEGAVRRPGRGYRPAGRRRAAGRGRAAARRVAVRRPAGGADRCREVDAAARAGPAPPVGGHGRPGRGGHRPGRHAGAQPPHLDPRPGPARDWACTSCGWTRPAWRSIRCGCSCRSGCGRSAATWATASMPSRRRPAHSARLRHAGPGLHRAAGDADGPAAVHRPHGRTPRSPT